MSMRPATPEGLKPKDLIGLPWRLAFALQDAGWWLRSEIIWNKPNAHPESVRDRPTKAHESLFLLSKRQDYYYDIDAVRGPNGRRLRTTWDIPTEPRKPDYGASKGHPAVMPATLAERCVSITSKTGDVVLDPFAGSGTTLIAAQRLDELSPTAILFVSRMVDSLSSPPLAHTNSKNTWLPPEWIEYFGLALSVHHGTTLEPLAQKGFETVFRNACESVRWAVEGPASETQRFLDLEIQRPGFPWQKLSLKSTAARNLSRTSIHISKLTEAAWVQDMRAARDRRERTLALFHDYMSAVDSIMMLRAFREGHDIPTKYQLVEIPSTICLIRISRSPVI